MAEDGFFQHPFVGEVVAAAAVRIPLGSGIDEGQIFRRTRVEEAFFQGTGQGFRLAGTDEPVSRNDVTVFDELCCFLRCNYFHLLHVFHLLFLHVCYVHFVTSVYRGSKWNDRRKEWTKLVGKNSKKSNYSASRACQASSARSTNIWRTASFSPKPWI